MKSSTFWGYARLIDTLAGALDIESAWAEGCSCHEDDLKEHRWYSQRQKAISERLHAEAGTVALAGVPGQARVAKEMCKLKGRRAHEYACGEYDAFVAHVLELAVAQVHAVCLEVPESDRATVYSDFQAAADIIITQSKIRSSFWKSLPWRLAGLAAEDSEQGRRVARECIALYTASSASGPNGLMHPITQRFLDPAPLAPFVLFLVYMVYACLRLWSAIEGGGARRVPFAGVW